MCPTHVIALVWLDLALSTIRVISLFVIAYFVLITLNYVFLYSLAIIRLRNAHETGLGEAIFTGFSGPSQPGVAVIVPAQTEGDWVRGTEMRLK